MKDNYSIEEILSAINDLQNISKNKTRRFQDQQLNLIVQIFPKNTLRLIEEAEKSKN